MTYRFYVKLRSYLYKYHNDKKTDIQKVQFRHFVYCLSSFVGGCEEYRKLLNLHEKTYISRYNKKRRWKKYLEKMVVPGRDLFLVSLTFTDDVLSSTSFSTRKKYVLRFLNDFCEDYFACADFGVEFGREHYHAICRFPLACSLVPFLVGDGKFLFFEVYPCIWDYGFCSFRLINSSADDRERSLFYAFKSSLYAFKSSEQFDVSPFHKRSSKKVTLASEYQRSLYSTPTSIIPCQSFECYLDCW